MHISLSKLQLKLKEIPVECLISVLSLLLSLFNFLLLSVVFYSHFRPEKHLPLFRARWLYAPLTSGIAGFIFKLICSSLSLYFFPHLSLSLSLSLLTGAHNNAAAAVGRVFHFSANKQWHLENATSFAPFHFPVCFSYLHGKMKNQRAIAETQTSSLHSGMKCDCRGGRGVL